MRAAISFFMESVLWLRDAVIWESNAPRAHNGTRCNCVDAPALRPRGGAATRSLETPFAQPLRRDPFLAGHDRSATVQRARHRVRAVVAEEHGVALHRRDLEVDVGEGR